MTITRRIAIAYSGEAGSIDPTSDFDRAKPNGSARVFWGRRIIGTDATGV